MDSFSRWSGRPRWIALAVASGGCAAFNGVFAKLTTTDLTTHIALSLATLLGLGSGEKIVEYLTRATFFALNLVMNGIMWALFTQALTAGTSTTQVAIVNTSANFLATAVLSFLIFAERLPPLWWAGAALLVVGNVIIGRREEGETGPVLGRQVGRAEEGEEGEGLLGGEEIDLDDRGGKGDVSGRAGSPEDGADEDNDVLDLGLERSEDERD